MVLAHQVVEVVLLEVQASLALVEVVEVVVLTSEEVGVVVEQLCLL